MNRHFTRRSFVQLVAFFAAEPLLSATTQTKSQGRPDESLKSEMQRAIEAHEMAGSVLLVSRSSHNLAFEALGYQDLERNIQMQTNTIFDLRSLTKVVTAVALMCLVEDGKLLLSDPVGKYLPAFAQLSVLESPGGQPRPPRRPITILDLLTHSSGMAVERPPQIENITRVLDRSLEEVVQIVATKPLEFEPGSRWMYSSMGFAVLGRVIEVLSGEHYEKFVARRVIIPLNMEDSFYFPLADKRDRIAAMYNLETGVLKRDSIDIYRTGAKYSAPEFGLYSTATDLQSLLLMMMNSGKHQGKQVLSTKSVSAMTTPHIPTTIPGVHQGLGWFLGSEPEKYPDFPFTKGSFGASGASGTFVWVDPSESLVRIFLIQRFGGDDKLRNTFMNLAAQLH